MTTESGRVVTKNQAIMYQAGLIWEERSNDPQFGKLNAELYREIDSPTSAMSLSNICFKIMNLINFYRDLEAEQAEIEGIII